MKKFFGWYILGLMLGLLSFTVHAADKKTKQTLEQRVSELETVTSQQASFNEFLEGRTEYLKAHIDALESNQRVNRASR